MAQLLQQLPRLASLGPATISVRELQTLSHLLLTSFFALDPARPRRDESLVAALASLPFPHIDDRHAETLKGALQKLIASQELLQTTRAQLQLTESELEEAHQRIGWLTTVVETTRTALTSARAMLKSTVDELERRDAAGPTDSTSKWKSSFITWSPPITPPSLALPAPLTTTHPWAHDPAIQYPPKS